MVTRPLLVTLCGLAASLSRLEADDTFPLVTEGVEVRLFAKEPLVRNPCALAFDAQGHLCVGMGPQYRNPTPDTPGDSVWILEDRDGDGTADARREYAVGFNAIQGLAWKGGALYVANAPDLTVVRDLDGDGEADEYVRLFTDLGNLEHGLHGLNWGPDGRLYMSKGNSKGLSRLPDRIAPKPFRDLWGAHVPGAADFSEPRVFTRETYQRNYHDPADDWGVMGGILRCEEGGLNLEIVARGFRNPWDIGYDDGFDWLGSDNDQTEGDKIIAPFFGAHFGWGHAWSAEWKGDGHLPTAPSSGPLFEGSGTGVVHLSGEAWPERWQDTWLLADWLRRELLVYRTEWDGAWRKPEVTPLEVLAHAGGGRAMSRSEGRSFDPVDIEIGPDGGIYIGSWGREYGAVMEDGEMANEGRIYRLDLDPRRKPEAEAAFRGNGLTDWPVAALIAELDSDLPVRRCDAQDELLRRGSSMATELQRLLEGKAPLPKRLETWVAWTFGRLDAADKGSGEWLGRAAAEASKPNLRLQALRILAWRCRKRGDVDLPESVRAALADPNPRVRHAAILAIHETGARAFLPNLLSVCETEADRVVFYSQWQALRALADESVLRALLADQRPALRRAALLALLEDDRLGDEEIRKIADDSDPVNAGLARQRLGGRARPELRGPSLTAGAPMPSRRPDVIPLTDLVSASGAVCDVAELRAGVPAYTDRPYRILEHPPSLEGEAFLRTANDDAEREAGAALTFNLKYPATLYLADDVRGSQLPRWMADDTLWERTEWEIRTTDADRMRLYRRDYPAGKVELGGNRDGLHGPKGNYLVVVVPKLLEKPTVPATKAASLALVPQGDPARGHDLFMSRHGAACVACHQVDGAGNPHAPDLSDIGSRADAAFLVESILEPTAAITEGFAMHVVRKKDGGTVAGILLGESGLGVKMALTGGVVVEVSRADIASRETAGISAMPASFSAMLGARQVADLTAWLLTCRKSQPAAAADFHFGREGDVLDCFLGNVRIARYLLDDSTFTRRAFVDVRTPSGLSVTRSWPAPPGEDHGLIHPGIWTAFGWIDGNDYWRMEAKAEHDGFVAEPAGGPGEASFAVRNRYLTEDGASTVCFERAEYRFVRVPDGVLLLIDTRFENAERDFAFGDQEESGLGIRVAGELRADRGGTIENDRGERNGAGTWGNEFRWIDYAGEVEGREAGLLVMAHPDNVRKSWSHSRDYGLLVANPFPRQPKERAEPYVKTVVRKGESLRLRYGILIHEGGLDREAAWENYRELAR
jgi:putative membrane-bound dehydrogenase-like protein